MGAWGYDHRGDSLIDKDEAKDLMTYCKPEWVSDYHFEKAHRHRAGKARRGANSSAIGLRSNAERSLEVAKCIADITQCNVYFTERTGEAKRPARMHRRSNAVLVAAALWAVGCDETVPNGAPEAVGEIDDLEIREGTTVEIAVAGYFSDPDGDDLVYSASSSDTDVATVAVSGDTLAVTGVAVGSAEVTVTASDGNLSAAQTFVATVRPPTNREVLEILYDETDGDNWTDNANWLTDRPLGEWFGVITDADGRVAGVALSINGLTGPIPPELGYLSNLRWLALLGNNLTGPIPPELGDLRNLQWLYLNDSNLTGPIPPELGSLSDLRHLYLSSNKLTGRIPQELGDLRGLEILRMHNNADLEGELPSSLSSLTSLEVFLAHGTDVCVPEALLDWYRDIPKRRAMLCAYLPADAYLVQASQSREYPVPVVAEKEGLLRVSVTATRTTTETLPPATATFYVDDEETYSVEIDGTSEPIPTEIDEGSLDKSLNVTIPDSVIEEGLSVVIEIDPDSTIDAEILTARRRRTCRHLLGRCTRRLGNGTRAGAQPEP